jgi:hypothetical protein
MSRHPRTDHQIRSKIPDRRVSAICPDELLECELTALLGRLPSATIGPMRRMTGGPVRTKVTRPIPSTSDAAVTGVLR